MKNLTVTLSVLALITACSACSKPSGDAPFVCQEVTPMDTPRPDILIVGDSISIGYTPYVTQALPQYEVVHNPCNGMTSVNGLNHVDSWLSLRPQWEVITFNHGLWDIVPFYNVPIELYKEALRTEGLKFKAAAKYVLFFTTTYVPPGTENRDNADVLRYNVAAREVMAELNIPVYDLYAVSAQIPLSLHTGPSDVHYLEAGSQILGDFVTQSILNEVQ